VKKSCHLFLTLLLASSSSVMPATRGQDSERRTLIPEFPAYGQEAQNIYEAATIIALYGAAWAEKNLPELFARAGKQMHALEDWLAESETFPPR